MDLDLNDDQVALRDGIASLLAARFTSERIRQGFDRAMFDDLAEAGVFTLRNDGFAWSDCVVVFEQLGRACVPGPLVPSMLLGDGRIATVRSGNWIEFLDGVDVVVEPGREGIAPDEYVAEVSPWPLDPLTPVSRIVNEPQDPGERLDVDWIAWSRAGAVLTAAFQLGLADRLTEMAVAYAKERQQFDRPIGGFQAIKHLCADMLVRTEVARAAVYAAGAHLDAGETVDGLDRAISGAKLLAGEAAVTNGKTATQVHGGMGYTWEVDVHLYLKRAWVLETHFGSADTHADLVAAALPTP